MKYKVALFLELIFIPVVISAFLYLSRSNTFDYLQKSGFLPGINVTVAKDYMFGLGTFISVLYSCFSVFIVKIKYPKVVGQKNYLKGYIRERFTNCVVDEFCRSNLAGGVSEKEFCGLINWLARAHLVVYLPEKGTRKRLRHSNTEQSKKFFVSRPELTRVKESEVFVQVEPRNSENVISQCYRKGDVIKARNFKAEEYKLTAPQKLIFQYYKYWIAVPCFQKCRGPDQPVLGILSLGSEEDFCFSAGMEIILAKSMIIYIDEVYNNLIAERVLGGR
ncbi:Hypothetical protein LUCI_2576 [Lucifera butyrica]|uniref:Uncharacterized protein n=1 Tax=Lucifera butyrica TaxID=1351585 RepID=A0A498RAK9_9FIRM|nr:hypothetical protein [Lucifera butyrica]VBB07332.1 Hypothetical protein LUCI_2576 [Lucifera butyrica]